MQTNRTLKLRRTPQTIVTATITALGGSWQKHTLAAVAIILLGLAVWPHRIKSAAGFLLNDCFLLEETYRKELRFFPEQYPPWVAAHRPLGRDAFTLLVRSFGENEVPMIWISLVIHLLSTMLVWMALYRLLLNWWAALAGSAFFLLSISAYLPIYWPVDIFDTLAGLFSASMLLLTAAIVRPERNYRPWLLLLMLPVFLAAAKSKETTIVLFLPLLLIVLSRQPGENGPARRSLLMRVTDRFKTIKLAEVVWMVTCVVLIALLAGTIITTRNPADPAHPYYSDYSPRVIGRSFVFYLGVLAFKNVEPRDFSPFLGLGLIIVPFVGSLLLKSRLLFIGWFWYVLSLLPLATFTNHFQYFYYPYVANIGAALALAALFAAIAELPLLVRLPKLARQLPAAATVLLLFLLAYDWIRNDPVPHWMDDYHARSRTMVQSLKRVLPAPERDSELVLVIPEVSQFIQGPNFLKVIYHDPTITGIAFQDRAAAGAHIAEHPRLNRRLAEWTGTEFKLDP